MTDHTLRLKHGSSLEVGALIIASIVLTYLISESYFYGLAFNIISGEFALKLKIFARTLCFALILISTFFVLRIKFLKLSDVAIILIYVFLMLVSAMNVTNILNSVFAVLALVSLLHLGKKYPDWIFRLVGFFLVLNGLCVISQAYFGWEFIFAQQLFMSGDQLQSQLIEGTSEIFGRQLRPPGIFSNTIYNSIFQLVGLLYVLCNHHKKFICGFLGFSVAFSGSLFSIVIFLIAVAFLRVFDRSLVFIAGFVLGFLFLLFAMPEWVQVNHIFEEHLKSVELRVSANNANNIFQQLDFYISVNYLENIGISLAVLSIIALITFSKKWVYFCINIVIVLLPIFLHPILHNISYTLLMVFMRIFLERNKFLFGSRVDV